MSKPTDNDDNEGFRSRLELLSDQWRSVSAFAKAVGTTQGNMRRLLLGGQEPTRVTLVSIARTAEVNLNWLATGAPPMRGRYEVVGVPVFRLDNPKLTLAKISTTQPDREFPIDPVLLEGIGVPADRALGLIQQGEAMASTIRPGDLVLVNRELNSLSVEGIYAVAFGPLISLRRMVPGASGPRLVTDNPAYRSEDIAAHQVDDLTVLGRVVWRAGQI